MTPSELSTHCWVFLSSWTHKLWSWRMNAEDRIVSGKMGDIWRPFLCNREPESCKGAVGDRSSERFQIKRRTQWLTQRFQEGFIPRCALTAVLNSLCESCSPLSSPAEELPCSIGACNCWTNISHTTMQWVKDARQKTSQATNPYSSSNPREAGEFKAIPPIC